MFEINATFEDCKIHATSQDGSSYTTVISDALTGAIADPIEFTPAQIGMLIAFNLDNNGEPEGFEKFYKELEPLISHLPTNLRPIP